MMRSICCWGAGRSSMKPDSVRGVILAIVLLLFRIRLQSRGVFPAANTKNNALIPRLWDESAVLRGATQIRGIAPFGLLVREGNRGRFRPRSAAVLPPVQAGSFQREIPLCEPVLRHTAAASMRCYSLRRREINGCREKQASLLYHSRFPAICQAMGRLLAGLTIMRQSRSPRASPSTSISAVAMLLAKGTLFWSHSREI